MHCICTSAYGHSAVFLQRLIGFLPHAMLVLHIYFLFFSPPCFQPCSSLSPPPARAAYISILRRRWGCTVAFAGARLSGCHGRTSRGVTVTITMRPTPGAWPRASTLATPHAWLRSSLPSSAGPPPGSVAIRLSARARARARTRTRAHAHTHAHTCSHVPCLL